jgi:hypothetical protein
MRPGREPLVRWVDSSGPEGFDLSVQLVEFPRKLADLPLRHFVGEERMPFAKDVEPPREVRLSVLEVLQL